MLVDISTETNDYQDIDDASRKISTIITDSEKQLEYFLDDNNVSEELCISLSQALNFIYEAIGMKNTEKWDLDRWMIFPATFSKEFAQKVFYELMFFVDFRAGSYEDYRWPLDFIDWDLATENLFQAIEHSMFSWRGEMFIAVFDWESCI